MVAGFPQVPGSRSNAPVDVPVGVWYDARSIGQGRPIKARALDQIRAQGAEKQERHLKASRSLIEEWQQNPEQWVTAVVHTQGEPGAHVPAVEKLGLAVTRTFRLTHTMAIRGSARGMLLLLDQGWVEKVEPDQTVRTQC